MSWLSAPIYGEFNSPYIAAYRQEMSWQSDRGFSEYRFDLLSLPNF